MSLVPRLNESGRGKQTTGIKQVWKKKNPIRDGNGFFFEAKMGERTQCQTVQNNSVSLEKRITESRRGITKKKGRRSTERCLKDWSRCPRPHGNGCHVFDGEQARAPACNQSQSEKQASGESKDLKALLTSHTRHHIFKAQRPWTDCSNAQDSARLMSSFQSEGSERDMWGRHKGRRA